METLLELQSVTFSRGKIGRSFIFGGNAHASSNRRIILLDINLNLRRGDRIGILGANGVGKSTLLRLMAGILTPEVGIVRRHAEVSTFFDSGYGMDPSLSGRDNAYSRGIIAGLSRGQAMENVAWVREFCELGDKFDDPIRTYSTGMTSRLSFSIDMSISHDILLIDEGFATADRHFQQKSTTFLDSVINKSSLVVLASHSNDVLRQMCNKGLVLRESKVQFYGDLESAIAYYESSI